MKKYFFIALVSSLSLLACSKVDVTQNPQPTNGNGQPVNTSPFNRNYSITNNETAQGIVEYRVMYTDCSGAAQDVALPMGQSIIVCLRTPAIQANFNYTLTLMP